MAATKKPASRTSGATATSRPSKATAKRTTKSTKATKATKATTKANRASKASRATTASKASKATKASSTARGTTKKQAPAKRAATAKSSAPKRAAAKRSAKKQAPPQRAAAKRPAKRQVATRSSVTKQLPAKQPANAILASSAVVGTRGEVGADLPAPRGVTKDGITYTKDFDVKFLKTQRDLLTEERGKLSGQATRLEDEANSLIEDGEMGDVQFDDESGEGDTMVVERERDLALSAQARQTIVDIDGALARIAGGTYGYSEVSGRPIPRERLEAIPWATVLVEEKVGGIGRR